MTIVGFILQHLPVPEPELPLISLDIARGERLVRTSKLGYIDTLALVFETGYVLLRANHADDESGGYTNLVEIKEPREYREYRTAFDTLVAAKLLTAEQVALYEMADAEYRKEQEKVARRAQYEELKKEFEGT
jgi:hypothetical protein